MRKLKAQPVDWPQIRRFLEGAAKKLNTARRILDIDEEASFQQAYEGMLKASLALMLAHGLRPRSIPGHHVAIIEFVEKKLGKDSRHLIELFDRMRRKRNQALYDVKGFVSKQDAEQALETAAEYLTSDPR
jgi:uncharacterized protein (UPF0332 family)